MLRWVPIFKREFKECLQSPATWITLGLLFMISGLLFTDLLSSFSEASHQAIGGSMFGVNKAPNATEDIVRELYRFMNFMVLIAVPMLTMRLVAEEKSRGTFELLVCCPVGDWAILLGKYFAVLAVGLLISCGMLIFPVITQLLGQANGSYVEWPVVIGCTCSLFLVFASYAAFGLMTSSFTDNQLVAAILSFIGLMTWFALGAIEFAQPQVKFVLDALSIYSHSDYLVKGIVQLQDLSFFALTSFLFLFVASQTLESRRWRI